MARNMMTLFILYYYTYNNDMVKYFGTMYDKLENIYIVVNYIDR